MVSDAAKKRRQNKKKEKKRLHNQTLMQESKSQTNLSQFLTADNDEGTKEIGDEELEELLADDDDFLPGSANVEDAEGNDSGHPSRDLTPTSFSHSKSTSLSNYNFFNDDKQDSGVDEEDMFGADEEDLFGVDEELEFLDDVEVSSEKETALSENEEHISEPSEDAFTTKVEKPNAEQDKAELEDLQQQLEDDHLAVTQLDDRLNKDAETAFSAGEEDIYKHELDEEADPEHKQISEAGTGNAEEYLARENDEDYGDQHLESAAEISAVEETQQQTDDVFNDNSQQEADEVFSDQPQQETGDVFSDQPQQQNDDVFNVASQQQTADVFNTESQQESNAVFNDHPQQETNDGSSAMPEFLSDGKDVPPLESPAHDSPSEPTNPDACFADSFLSNDESLLHEDLLDDKIAEHDNANEDVAHAISKDSDFVSRSQPSAEHSEVSSGFEYQKNSDASVDEEINFFQSLSGVSAVIPEEGATVQPNPEAEDKSHVNTDIENEIDNLPLEEDNEANDNDEFLNDADLSNTNDVIDDSKDNIINAEEDEAFFNKISEHTLTSAAEESVSGNDQTFSLPNEAQAEDEFLTSVQKDIPLSSTTEKSDEAAKILSLDEVKDDNLLDESNPLNAESLIDSDESLLLDSDIEISEAEQEELEQDSKSQIDNTVIKSSLPIADATLNESSADNENDISLLEEDEGDFLEDDDSLLDSDEDFLLEETQKDVDSKASNFGSNQQTKGNKYAPVDLLPDAQFNFAGNTSQNAITPQIVLSTRPNIVSPQIVKTNQPLETSNEYSSHVKTLKSQKQKTDAYDFPVDLVASSNPPSKAKAIKTLSTNKMPVGVPSSMQPTLSSKQDGVVQPPSAQPVSNIPVNPYASSKKSKQHSTANPYAPKAAPEIKPISPVNNIGSGIDFMKPGLNIVSQPNTVLNPGFNSSQPPVSSNQPPSKPLPFNPSSVPASNTDLPFNVPLPKAVPRVRNNSNKLKSTPPLPVSTRARAVSNVSATSLSNNGKINSPVNNIFDSSVHASANGMSLSQTMEDQRKKSRSTSSSGNVAWGTTANSSNAIINPYAPNIQHTRKTSSISFSPINTGVISQDQQPLMSPTLSGLPPVGLNSSIGNTMSGVNSNVSGHKVSHARSQSSVYVPNKSNGAGAKYAPIVHPSVQHAYSQQQQQQPYFNQQLPNEYHQNDIQLGQNIATNTNIATQQFKKNAYVPFAAQQNQIQQHHSLGVANPNLPVQHQGLMHNADLNNLTSSNALFSNNRSLLPDISISATQKATLPSVQHQTRAEETVTAHSGTYANERSILSKQIPILQWAPNGKVLSLKPDPYSGVANIKITPFTSCVEVPRYFLEFPGPLYKNKTKPKTILNWMVNTVSLILGDSAYDMNGKILWKLLSKKIALIEEKSDTSSLYNYAAELFDPKELLTFIQNSSLHDSRISNFTNQQQMTGFKLDFEGLAHVLTFLRVGDHSKALEIALSNNDFSMAMVIASLMGKEKWTEVVDLYLKKEFQGSGPDSEFAVNLLSAIFQVYIGNGKSLVEDFAVNVNKTQWAVQNWNVILAAILSNGKSTIDSVATHNLLVSFLVDFGVFLYQQNEFLAANCCFVLANIPLSDQEIVPATKVYFKEVGAPNSLDSMLLSELYEFSFNAAGSKFNGFVSLLPSKIVRSEVLLLESEYNLANKYLDACMLLNKELPKNSSLSIKFSYVIDKLKTQATDHSQSWIGKPTLSGVWGTLDKSFNKLIGGDDVGVLDESIPKSESKLFDNYGTTISRTNSQMDLNTLPNFVSPSTINGRLPPVLKHQQSFGTTAGPGLLHEPSHPYGINKNVLSKSAVAQMKNENGVDGVSSGSSIASSEHFNQQVANNLAKLHSHSRNQSTDSLLSFDTTNQRFSKRSSVSSHVSQKKYDPKTSLSDSVTGNKYLPTSSHQNYPPGSEFEDQQLSTLRLDSDTERTVKKSSLNQFDNGISGSTKPLISSTNRYSPEKNQNSSPLKYVPSPLIEETKMSETFGSNTGVFNQSEREGQAPVNSPPKGKLGWEEEKDTPKQIGGPSDFAFPVASNANSQSTLNASNQQFFENNREAENQPAILEADLSPHTSASNLPNNGLISPPKNKSYNYESPSNIQANGSSLATPIRSNYEPKEYRSARLQTDFLPPSKPFSGAQGSNSPSYTPVTPQNQQGGGWTRTHSRSSSQILAEITGTNSLNSSSGFNNATSGFGGSTYTSRNVSIDSNFASAEPVIRQVRSSSVVFTPDSKRKPTEKLYYDDIVEEEGEDADERASQAEAALIESKLAKAREEAERNRKLAESSKKEQQEMETKKKDGGKAEAAGWFGWLKSNPNEKKPIKAKLGTKNQFYYDEKLKRWVNKNATDDEKKEMEDAANTPPPPPPVIKKKSVQPETKPRSGSVLGGPTQRTMGVQPPRNPITGESLIPEIEPDRASFNTAGNQTVIQTVPEEETFDKENQDNFNTKPAANGRRFVSNINLTSSGTGLDDLLSLGTPPPGAAGSGGPPGARIGTPPTGRIGSGVGNSSSRRTKRSNRGYVNVMDTL